MSSYPTVFSNQYYLNLLTSQYKTSNVFTIGVLQYGSPVVTAIANTNGIEIGALVIGIGIPTSTTVISIGTNSVTLSNNATAGLIEPAFTFDTSGYGFDQGRWTNLGLTQLSFFAGPSPKLNAWLNANLQLGNDIGTCLQSFVSAFTLYNPNGQQAVGAQLDILGQLIGQSRSVPILNASVVNGGSGYALQDLITVTQVGGGSGMTLRVAGVSSGVVTNLFMITPGSGYTIGDSTTSGGSGLGLTVNLQLLVLDDSDYRTLLMCKTAINHWNGQISHIPELCVANGGSGYVVGDIVNVLQSQAYGMEAEVRTISSSPLAGVVTSVSLVTPGSGYSMGQCTTSGGTGTGLTLYLPSVNTTSGGSTIGNIQQMWANTFGSQSIIYIQDNGKTSTFSSSTVMTAGVNIGFGGFTSTAVTALAVNGYLVPRSQGVQYSYNIFKTPVLGFDLETNTISGFDVGFFT